eukprot:2674817-Pyramimonas_sp.AAC.1
MRIACWEHISTADNDREHAIHIEFANVDIIFLMGTQRRALHIAYAMEDLPNLKSVHCGYHHTCACTTSVSGVSFYM